MDVVTLLAPVPRLRRPVLVAAFRGWNDAGEAASGAASVLAHEAVASEFAEIDPEEFFDFQATRPTVAIVDGGSRQIDWPANTFSWADAPGADRHLVVLNGTEPNLRWRTFVRGIAALAAELGVELVLTLGALQLDVPHTRPVPVSGSASDPGLAQRLGLRRSGYEGPTGITGLLHHTCSAAGLDAVSLWAGIPHYLAGTAYLAGALALAERAVGMVGADLSLHALARDAVAQRDDIAELVAEDEDLAEYVGELERRHADDPTEELELQRPDLPSTPVSGDDLAAELERYLRDRGTG